MAKTVAEYVSEIEEAFEAALLLAHADDWKHEKSDSKTGDKIEYKTKKDGKKIYKSKARIEIPPKLLVEHMLDSDNVTSWNGTLEESKLLKKLTDEILITYSVTKDSGPVASRDFVYGSKCTYVDKDFVLGGKSIDYPVESSSKIVRAINGVGCHIVSPVEGEENMSDLTWVMDCDYKGWMPQAVLHIANPIAQTMFNNCVRELGKKLKKDGKF